MIKPSEHYETFFYINIKSIISFKLINTLEVFRKLLPMILYVGKKIIRAYVYCFVCPTINKSFCLYHVEKPNCNSM